ncbi:hypothetical protein N0V92_007035 [Colletotrichum tropicale]|nr:hypothetical protein N0V92_007035 [Colletotrichum tropicale]
MPGDKTVSIAAPASYWYLKQFLIAEMSEHLDYIIYMTYDLHVKPNMTSHSYLLAGGLTNGEINEIIAEGRVKKQWIDETESDYLVHDDGEWEAYMDDANKQARIAKYRSLNFGRSTDWAVDHEGEPGEVAYLDPKVYDNTPAQCSPPCLFVFPPSALPSATAITIPAYTTSIVLQGGSTKTITDDDDWIQPEEPKPPFTEVPFDDWPNMELVPVPTPVPDEGEDDDNGKHKSSCRL